MDSICGASIRRHDSCPPSNLRPPIVFSLLDHEAGPRASTPPYGWKLKREPVSWLSDIAADHKHTQGCDLGQHAPHNVPRPSGRENREGKS
jgi:hypothetical protein